MGVRCCAGATNDAEVTLDLRGTPGLMLTPGATASSSLAPAIAAAANSGATSIAAKPRSAWTWTPVANERLVIASGCTEPPRGCGLVVARDAGDAGAMEILVSVATGKDLPEVSRGASARRVRVRALDPRGVYSRELSYLYGRVDLGDMTRP